MTTTTGQGVGDDEPDNATRPADGTGTNRTPGQDRGDDAGAGGDTLDVLAASGFALAALTDEQRDVLRTLNPQELAMILDIKARLDDVGPDVQAHSEIAGGALF